MAGCAHEFFVFAGFFVSSLESWRVNRRGISILHHGQLVIGGLCLLHPVKFTEKLAQAEIQHYYQQVQKQQYCQQHSVAACLECSLLHQTDLPCVTTPLIVQRMNFSCFRDFS